MISARHALAEFRANWRDPAFWAEAPEFAWRNGPTAPMRRLALARHRRREVEPLALAEADWDNCLLLDACRYDAFRAVLEDTDDLQCRLAPGTQTGAFLERTFPPGASFPDLVYVTANPRVAAEPTGGFHALEHLWESAWDDDFGTVLPDAVREGALAAIERYPNKRLLVHFVQPHIPFIGETARDLSAGAAIQTMRPDQDTREPKPYAAVAEGNVSPRTVRRAYYESLEHAMTAVRDLVATLPGKTVVTADHGELLGESAGRAVGEFSRWGHPAKTPVAPLLDVPWWEPPFERRRRIHDGTTTDGDRAAVADEADERLARLGYA